MGAFMAKKRVFVSFDFDNDLSLKNLLVGQARNEDSPFDVTDFSLKESHPEADWLENRCETLLQSTTPFLESFYLRGSLWCCAAILIAPKQCCQARVSAGIEEEGLEGPVQYEGKVTPPARRFWQLLLITQLEAQGALAIGVQLTKSEPHGEHNVR